MFGHLLWWSWQTILLFQPSFCDLTQGNYFVGYLICFCVIKFKWCHLECMRIRKWIRFSVHSAISFVLFSCIQSLILLDQLISVKILWGHFWSYHERWRSHHANESMRSRNRKARCVIEWNERGKENWLEEIKAFIEGVFLVRDNRVFNGPLGRSLRSFARTAHSTYSLRSALLR